MFEIAALDKPGVDRGALAQYGSPHSGGLGGTECLLPWRGDTEGLISPIPLC